MHCSPPRAHACCVSDVRAEHGMERNIGDQLNKAFEAYRQVSIEKDNVKKELQQKVTAVQRTRCKAVNQISCSFCLNQSQI